MNMLKIFSAAVLAASCGAALAEMPRGPGGPGAPPGGPGGPGGPARPPGLHIAHGVDFDEAQDDKVFAILHAQEPQRREQARILRQSQDALRALAASGQYDEAKAVTLSKAAGAAMAALALMEARSDARILALMTPEQRRAAEAARGPRPARSER